MELAFEKNKNHSYEGYAINSLRNNCLIKLFILLKMQLRTVSIKMFIIVSCEPQIFIYSFSLLFSSFPFIYSFVQLLGQQILDISQ